MTEQDPNQFRAELDEWGNSGNVQDSPDRIIAYHNARAAINLYEEIAELRRAVHAAKDAINGASENTKNAIDNASTQSTKLGKKVLWLNWVLVAIAIVGAVFTGIKVYQEFIEDSPLAVSQPAQQKAPQGKP